MLDSKNNITFGYYLYDFWKDHGDPVYQSTKLFGIPVGVIGETPWFVAICVFLYLLISIKLGSAYMKNREPYRIRKLIIAYNLIMVCVNAYYFIVALQLIDYGGKLAETKFPGKCPDTPEARYINQLLFGYAASKLADWLDTMFFIMRKKFGHVTFLHLYHHTIVPCLAWYANFR